MSEGTSISSKTLFAVIWRTRRLSSADRSSVLACAFAGVVVFGGLGLAHTLLNDRATRWLTLPILPVFGGIWGWWASYVPYKARAPRRPLKLTLAVIATFVIVWLAALLLLKWGTVAAILSGAIVFPFIVTWGIFSLPETWIFRKRLLGYVAGVVLLYAASIPVGYALPGLRALADPAWLRHAKAILVPAIVFSSLDLARLYGRRVSARTILSRVGLSLLAVSILGMVLFRKPILSETHFWLGTWALRKQESAGEIPAPVRHHWQRAFDLNPGNLKAKFWLAMARDSDVLGALGHRNYEQAVRLAEDNVRFMPEYSGFHQTLSIARRDAGDLKGAAEAMKQAIFVQRNTDMVRFAPRVMLPIWTSESDLHHILAHIYYDMEHYTEAYEEMKHIGRIINRRQAEIGIHWDPIFSPSDEVFIGKILWKLEEKEAAELCFRSALRRGGKYTRETTMEQLRLFGWEPPASDEGVGIPVGPLIPIAPGEVIGEDQDARPGNDEPAPR